jgi:hypothetical protein
MKHYSTNAIKNLTDKYISNGGQVVELIEGVLGYGTTICFGENLKCCVIQEKQIFESSWSSTHTIRFYNNMPKKYQSLLNN